MPGKGRKHSGGAKGTKEHGDKKAAGASKPAEKKAAEATEKKPGASGVSQPAGAQASGATGTSKAQPSQEKTMKPADPKKQPSQEKPTKPVDPKAQPTQEKPPTDPKTQPSQEKPQPADTKPKQTPKSEPAKSTQSTKPKDTATSTVTAKASTGKPVSKQDPKPASGKEKTEVKVSSGAAGKVAATAVAGTVVAAATAGAVAAVSTKPKDEGKEVKKAVGADKVSAAAPTPAKSAADDALDDLIDSLGGPENVPESPKFTGPEIKEGPRSSEHLEGLGERDSTIPPDYRHLLDGKGEKPVIPPEDLEPPLGEDDLLDALSSDFASCPAPPKEKKPKLETMAIKPTCATAVSSELGKEVVPDDALDELLGTLEGPPANVPESPTYTGNVVTETIIPTYLEKVGEREGSIPPEYRKLLDGKDHGKDLPPPAPAAEPKPLDDFELADEFSKDFDSSDYPAVPVVTTSTSTKPTECKAAKQLTAREVIASSASNTQAAAAPSGNMDSALDELMGTLDGPEFAVAESPEFTGPVVTETSTATNIEELGKRETTIPPKYRNLLDGKVDGKVVPPPPEEKPMDEDELAAALDFGCSTPSSDKPTPPSGKPAPPSGKPTPPASTPTPPASTPTPPAGTPTPPAGKQTPPAKPKESSEKAKADSDVISASCSSAVQAAPAPSKEPVPKASAPKSDPFDALSGTLGVRQAEDNKDKKPAAAPVKEKTDQEKRDKLGEDENTIPPDYRLLEVKDKDGKPILPKREDQPKEMSEEDLLDALTEGFLVSPATTTKTAPLQCSAKDAKSKPGAEEVVSCSKASAVQAGAPQPAKADSQIPDDALDLLSGSLGTRELEPEDNKPLVDKVKEKATSEHIERLGDRDSTIPPEYRHLLDGKDDKGQPIKPPAKEDANREKLSDGAAAIDALSSDFESCATKSTEKTQQTSKDKTGKCSSGAAVSQPSGKASEPAKEKTEKCSSSTKESQSSGKASDPPKDKTEKCSSAAAVSQPSGKASEPAKPKNETSSAKPSAQKPYRS